MSTAQSNERDRENTKCCENIIISTDFMHFLCNNFNMGVYRILYLFILNVIVTRAFTFHRWSDSTCQRLSLPLWGRVPRPTPRRIFFANQQWSKRATVAEKCPYGVQVNFRIKIWWLRIVSGMYVQCTCTCL